MLTYLTELQNALARQASSINRELMQTPSTASYLELRKYLVRAQEELVVAVGTLGAAIQAYHMLPDVEKAWRRRV